MSIAEERRLKTRWVVSGESWWLKEEAYLVGCGNRRSSGGHRGARARSLVQLQWSDDALIEQQSVKRPPAFEPACRLVSVHCSEETATGSAGRRPGPVREVLHHPRLVGGAGPVDSYRCWGLGPLAGLVAVTGRRRSRLVDHVASTWSRQDRCLRGPVNVAACSRW